MIYKQQTKSRIPLIIICMAALLLPVTLQKQGYLINMLFMIGLFAYLATSWNILSGYSGQVSLGQSVFLGVGAYMSSVMYTKLGVNPWIAMFLGALGCAALGIFLGLALFRLRTAFFTLATLALLRVFFLLAVYLVKITNGSMGIILPLENKGLRYINFSNKMIYVYFVFGLVALAAFVSYKVKYSKFGLKLTAIRDDHDAAESLGINTYVTKLKAMALSAFLISIGGSLYSHYVLYIDPPLIFNADFSIKMTLMSMIGGLGTIWGPLLGAMLLVPLDTLLRAFLGGGKVAGINLIVYGVFMIVIVRFMPQGILSKIKLLSLSKLRKSKAKVSVVEISPQITPDENCSIDLAGSLPDKEKKEGRILEVNNLTVRFGGLLAVNNFSFHVNYGEIIGLIGPNGAGKTTAFNAISGYVRRTSGEIIFKGKQIMEGVMPHTLCEMGMTRTFQSVKPFNRVTLEENVMAGAVLNSRNYKEVKAKAHSLLDIAGFSGRYDIYPTDITIAEQKRLDLIRAVAVGADIIMLDEPMAGLTHNEVDGMLSLIRKVAKSGVTIIIIEHVMYAVMNLCERIVVLDHGEKIAEGVPGEIAKNAKVIDVYLGEKCDA